MKTFLSALGAALILFPMASDALGASCGTHDVIAACFGESTREIGWVDSSMCPDPTFKIERKINNGSWVTIATGVSGNVYYDDLTLGSGSYDYTYRVSCEACNPAPPAVSNTVACPE